MIIKVKVGEVFIETERPNGTPLKDAVRLIVDKAVEAHQRMYSEPHTTEVKQDDSQ